MTRDEAEALRAQLAAGHPDRATHHWRAQQASDGDWIVVKIALPAPAPLELNPETRADERPPSPQDPRDGMPPQYGVG